MVTSSFCTFWLKCLSYNIYSLCLLLVTVAKYSQVYPEDRISTVMETITVESRKEFVVEETVVPKFPKQIIPEQKISQPVSEREDDWFVLLDVAARETSFVPPGIVDISSSLISLFCNFCGLKWLSYLFILFVVSNHACTGLSRRKNFYCGGNKNSRAQEGGCS